MSANQKPVIAITMAEAAGIGPEILIKTLAEKSILEVCRPIIIGDRKVMEKANRALTQNIEFNVIEEVEKAGWESDKVNLIDLDNIPLEALQPGKPNAVTGKAMIEYTELAVRLALDKKVQGAVGGPHSKKAADDAGISFNGYPGLIAGMAGTHFPFLLLVAGNLRVSNVTLHVSLRRALDMISKELVLECIKATNEGVKTFGVARPRIAVAGLNPHAGEDRMFGDEDEDEIKPAIQAAQALGIDVTGPHPADSLFYGCTEGKFDAYVGMYHDQAHLPVKIVSFKSASAVAIGVPINWATVDHGCALDIAWKGVADPNVIMETVKLISRRAANFD